MLPSDRRSSENLKRFEMHFFSFDACNSNSISYDGPILEHCRLCGHSGPLDSNVTNQDILSCITDFFGCTWLPFFQQAKMLLGQASRSVLTITETVNQCMSRELCNVMNAGGRSAREVSQELCRPSWLCNRQAVQAAAAQCHSAIHRLP